MRKRLLSLLDIEKNDLFFMHSWLTDHDYIEYIPFNVRILMQMSYCYKKTKNTEDYQYDLHQSVDDLINTSQSDKRLFSILEMLLSLDKKKFFRL